MKMSVPRITSSTDQHAQPVCSQEHNRANLHACPSSLLRTLTLGEHQSQLQTASHCPDSCAVGAFGVLIKAKSGVSGNIILVLPTLRASDVAHRNFVHDDPPRSDDTDTFC